MKKTLSVIIPNYNGKHLLEANLPSVINAVEQAKVPYEIIIVDDGSKDGSILFIQNNYPNLILIINPENKGFSYTCNQGIKMAKYELTLILNSDVRLDVDYFESQWQYFQREDTFGVMGKIMSMDGSKIEDAARIYFYQGGRLKANHFYYSTNTAEDNLYTAYLSGANALIDTKKLKELQGFNEIYSPFTYEDTDLSLRAWLSGWKCYYEHNSTCYHQVSGSIRTQIKSSFIKKIYFRNRFLFNHIHLTGFRSLIWPLYVLFIETLPKLLTGKLWVLNSYIEYINLQAAIRASKESIKDINQHKSTLELNDVINMINQSLTTKPIRFL
jgi:GT2 family glycosyltransferase